MLIALGRGDKYRLTHIRESLESGKELFISDKEFLQDLVKTYLKDRIYQAKIVSISDKPNTFCESCDSAISADEKFCTSCGTAKLEPTPEPETKLESMAIKKMQDLPLLIAAILLKSQSQNHWKDLPLLMMVT